MTTLKLTFGKFKGQNFSDTPKWYQEWLLKQDWFNNSNNEKPIYNKLNGWDGYSKKGEAIYDAVFDQEKRLADKADSDWFNEVYGY
jgi:hypothetical protein